MTHGSPAHHTMHAFASPTPAAPRGSEGRSFPFVLMAATLTVAVVVLRLLLTRHHNFCGTPDACYYLGMAQNLASGKGFQARFLYDFQQAHPAIPNTGIEYWRPGVSLLLYPLRFFGGVTLQHSIVLTALVGVLFSAAAWQVAMRATGRAAIALTAYALCLLSSSAWVGSASPDSGLYYGAAVAWFLALFTVRWQGVLSDVLALLCVAVAYLIRNDAVLLLVPLLVVLGLRRRRAALGGQAASGRTGYMLLLLLGFAAALVPMHLLYRSVLGTAFPSGTAAVLYLNDLSDFSRYGEPVSLRTLLAHGIFHLAAFRVTTLATIVYRVAVLMVGYPALVFLPGLCFIRWTPSRALPQEAPAVPELVGGIAFGATVLLVYGLVLPAIGGFSALRSAVGLLPLLSTLAMVAIFNQLRTPRLAAWTAWAVVAATGLSGLMEARRDLPAAAAVGASEQSVATALRALGADPARTVVLTNDPVQFSVSTGFGVVQLPNNGPEAIIRAARDFHAGYVVLEAQNDSADLAVLTGALHPLRTVSLPQEHSLILQLPDSVTER